MDRTKLVPKDAAVEVDERTDCLQTAKIGLQRDVA
jgi:hypothetical protein